MRFLEILSGVDDVVQILEERNASGWGTRGEVVLKKWHEIMDGKIGSGRRRGLFVRTADVRET